MTFKSEKVHQYFPIFMWLLLVVFLLVRFAEPMKDGDVYWHIKNGEYHIQNQTLLMDHSVYSWTPAIKYAPYCTWAVDVILYALFGAGGWPLMYCFMYVLLFFPVLMAGLFARRVGVPANGFLLCTLLMLQLAVADASYLKPELFSLAFFVLISALYFYIKIDHTNKKKGLFFLYLPLIYMLWANMHGVFFIGLVLLGAIIVGEVINYWTKRKSRFPKSTVITLSIAGMMSGVVTLLTPYGTELITNLLNLSSAGVSSNISANIIAFQSVFENIHRGSVELKMEYWGVMAVSFVILFAIYARKNRDLDFGVLLPTLFLSFVYLKYLRASFYWPPFWAISLIYLASKERVDLMSVIRKSKPITKYGLALLLIGISIFFPGRALYDAIYQPLRYSYFGYGANEGLPVQESKFLKEHNIGTKLFNSYNAGAYLIFDLYPERKVFIDNRSFPYRDNIYNKYMALRDGQVSLGEMEAEFRFDAAVITHHEIVLNQFLSSDQWRPVYYGSGGVVFVKNDSDFERDIRSLDRHRLDGVKNIIQAASIIRTAQNLNDIDAADHVIDIMKNRLSHQKMYGFFYPYYTNAQNGLRAFAREDYKTALNYLWSVGFNDSNIKINSTLKTLINMKILANMNARRYQDALPFIARLLNFYQKDADVMYNAGVIAYLVSLQAEKKGVDVKLPSWKETFKRFIDMKPDHPYASIAKKLLMNETIDGKLPLAIDVEKDIKSLRSEM